MAIPTQPVGKRIYTLAATLLPRLKPAATLQDKLAVVLTLAYQLAALVVIIITPILFAGWARQPFIGVLVEHTLVSNGTGPAVPGSWEAYARGLDKFGYQLIEIDGIPVGSAEDIQLVLQPRRAGQKVRLSYLDPQDNPGSLEVTLQTLSLADQFALFYLPYFIGLVYFICGVWVYSLRKQDVPGRGFALFSTAVAVTLVTLGDLSSTHWFTRLWAFSLALSGGSMILLGLVFPQPVRLVQRYPLLRWSPLLVSLVLGTYAITTHFNFNAPRAYLQAWLILYVFVALAILIFFGWMIVQRFRSLSPIVREQARVILTGAILAFGPIMVWFIAMAIRLVSFQPWLLVFLMVFPVATAFAILRYRIMSTDYFIARSLMYILLFALTVGAYALLVWAGSLLAAESLDARSPLLIGAFVFVFVLVFNPLRSTLETAINNTFFRGLNIFQDRLQRFSRDLTQSMDLVKITTLLHNEIDQSLQPSALHIFLYDAVNEQYSAARVEGKPPGTDLRFGAGSPFLTQLQAENKPIFIAESEPGAAGGWDRFGADAARLALLGAQLYIPMAGQQRLAGWLALGPKRSGEPFRRRDVSFVESLADQSALAVQRAQVIHSLERRVHEVNVLARVAQGVNITVNFDDILELVFAQTTQVLPASFFTITLHNKPLDTYAHAFYLENDDRLAERENQPLPSGLGLVRDIIQNRRAIRTEDYERECLNHSVLPVTKGLYAWVGVPLNTGAETIGAICLGSSDPSVSYTLEQQNLLQAIADQAAGAIVKSRLLQESERRARLLQMLNQVGRSLTSTLEFDPLLQQILQSAVDILACEAGSLLLVDEKSKELIFAVTVGPVAEDLVGVRLAPGTGLVGKAVDTRQPVIVNNVLQDKNWFQKADEKTGFITRELLVVPMLYRDLPIGVIEVINKTDKMPFTQEDESLLTAFTAQAAVAIQNARLFTMTDQALADRVEELSVMQRIDRELNATLNVQKALQITLDWAINQSGANLGVAVSIQVEEEGPRLRVMAAEGGGLEILPGGQPAAWMDQVIEHSLLQLALENGQPQRVQDADTAQTSRLHPRTQGQVVVPIRREDDTLGLLYLESWQAGWCDDNVYDFLVRLGDHAAIAVSNARLYDEVQAANQAKNDFISFVSHELKTPMTSIRGYTDLILAGAVGQVSEAQTGFLKTIRSNIERMASLVSDLADVSRIEAGKLRLEFGAVVVREIIEDVVRSSQKQIEDKQQRLHLQIVPGLPPAWADKNRLNQVLTNLVSNAYKYTPQNGEIFVRVEQTDNEWDPKGAPEVLLVSVQDTGIGIKPEDQKQIFTKFFRSDDMKARESPGTGLGLNITKNLVELQGGRIWFESAFRKGTTFYFTIPVAEVS